MCNRHSSLSFGSVVCRRSLLLVPMRLLLIMMLLQEVLHLHLVLLLPSGLVLQDWLQVSVMPAIVVLPQQLAIFRCWSRRVSMTVYFTEAGNIWRQFVIWRHTVDTHN